MLRLKRDGIFVFFKKGFMTEDIRKGLDSQELDLNKQEQACDSQGECATQGDDNEHKNHRVKSFVIRAGRMTNAQKNFLQSMQLMWAHLSA